MKKIFALILVLVLSCNIPITSFSENQFSNIPFKDMNEDQLSPYFDLVINTVNQFNRIRTTTQNLFVKKNENIALSKSGESIIAQLPLSQQIESYLSYKLIYENTVVSAINIFKSNIQSESNILSWEIVEDSLVCKLSTRTEYKYSNASSSSLRLEHTQVVLENPQNPIIVDMYTDAPGKFDNIIRGSNLDLTCTENQLKNEDLISLGNAIVQSVSEIKMSAKANKLLFDSEKPMSIAENVQSQTSSVNYTRGEITFDEWMDPKSKAVHYASQIIRYYCTNPIPAYSSPSYYDFSTISGSYDCTNFISHCLIAGEFSMLTGSNLSDSCWYYTNLSNRSTSWSGVNQLRNFLVYNTNYSVSSSAPHYTYINESLINPYATQSSSSVRARSGDIIQIKYNTSGAYGYPDFGHSTIICNVLDSAIYIAWRTSDYSAEFNVPLYESFPPAPNTTSGSGGHIYRLFKIDYPTGTATPPIN